MQKTFFSGFLCFAKDETDYFPYSNLIQNLFGIPVFAKISRNKCGIIDLTRILIKYSIKFTEHIALLEKHMIWEFITPCSQNLWYPLPIMTLTSFMDEP